MTSIAEATPLLDSKWAEDGELRVGDRVSDLVAGCLDLRVPISGETKRSSPVKLDDVLCPQDRVRVHGLKSYPELNSKEGLVISRQVNGRYGVRLEGFAPKSLKRENLTLLASASSADADKPAGDSGSDQQEPQVIKFDDVVVWGFIFSYLLLLMIGSAVMDLCSICFTVVSCRLLQQWPDWNAIKGALTHLAGICVAYALALFCTGVIVTLARWCLW